jgi:hypothetical protein
MIHRNRSAYKGDIPLSPNTHTPMVVVVVVWGRVLFPRVSPFPGLGLTSGNVGAGGLGAPHDPSSLDHPNRIPWPAIWPGGSGVRCSPDVAGEDWG